MDRVIGMMVRYEPSDRISAEELVRLIPEDWLLQDECAT